MNDPTNKRSPSYERGEVRDVEILKEQEQAARDGADQRSSLLRLIQKAAKQGRD